MKVVNWGTSAKDSKRQIVNEFLFRTARQRKLKRGFLSQFRFYRAFSTGRHWNFVFRLQQVMLVIPKKYFRGFVDRFGKYKTSLHNSENRPKADLACSYRKRRECNGRIRAGSRTPPRLMSSAGKHGDQLIHFEHARLHVQLGTSSDFC